MLPSLRFRCEVAELNVDSSSLHPLCAGIPSLKDDNFTRTAFNSDWRVEFNDCSGRLVLTRDERRDDPKAGRLSSQPSGLEIVAASQAHLITDR
jgi:hypothetical protein